MEFRLKAHDPREIDKYSDRWEQEEWTYNETEMEQELFEHRLGESPALEMILASMPITTQDKIPSDGKQHQAYQTYTGVAATEASLSETEAVLVDNHGDSLILKELFKTCPKFGTTRARALEPSPTDQKGVEPTEPLYRCEYLDGDIKAVWDSNTRKGVSTVLFFWPARCVCVSPAVPVVSPTFTLFLFSLRL